VFLQVCINPDATASFFLLRLIIILGPVGEVTVAVIKVVRFGIDIAFYPNEHAMDLVESQITKQ
jgi:hypothetical protein